MIPLDILLAAIGVTALLFLTVGMCIAPQRKRPRWQETKYDYCHGDIPNIIPLKGHSERYFTKMDGR
jgi:hypothetical protein